MRIILLLTAVFPCFAFCQGDTASTNPQAIDFAAEIFNGKEHSGYIPNIKGTAYYNESDWQPGTVRYRDVYYPSVWLKYDMVQKELIVRHPASKVAITLFTPRISSFSISGRNFIRIDENDSSCLSPGIYEEVGKGKLNFYILRSKYLLEEATPYGMEREFLTNDTYYVVKNNKCYPIKKKKNIWSLVGEKKSAIKADLRKKDLTYKRYREETLTEIINFYNNATN
jgi:hypothetical protein